MSDTQQDLLHVATLAANWFESYLRGLALNGPNDAVHIGRDLQRVLARIEAESLADARERQALGENYAKRYGQPKP